MVVLVGGGSCDASGGVSAVGGTVDQISPIPVVSCSAFVLCPGLEHDVCAKRKTKPSHCLPVFPLCSLLLFVVTVTLQSHYCSPEV